jgi:hypothetical protein
LSQSRQARLDYAVIGPSSQLNKASSPAVDSPKSTTPRKPRKKKEEAKYVVLSETDDEVEIDITGTVNQPSKLY